MTSRATIFQYTGLEIDGDILRASFALDNQPFVEEIRFDGLSLVDNDGVKSIAELWYLVAGLSYYKAGAAHSIDLGTLAVGENARRLFDAALHDGLGEYSYRNDLPLDDVTITGGTAPVRVDVSTSLESVLTPFGGGIDSVVTTQRLSPQLDQALFVVSPPSGYFEPLERTAALTGLPVLRATRTLDPAIINGDPSFLNGHVPVTAMITLLAVVAALASGHGAVVMSNEHSASIPNLRWRDRDINHQWSKSWSAEQLMGDAVAERIGDDFVVASFLRDRTELWVAREFASLPDFHDSFRSCNRAFTQARELRAANWCGECDKCLFINLVLAPFMDRDQLANVMGVEPLSDPARFTQLETLVGLGSQRKPFECVGDPGECSIALRSLAMNSQWADESNIANLAPLLSPDMTLDDAMDSQGVSRVPANWFR